MLDFYVFREKFSEGYFLISVGALVLPVYNFDEFPYIFLILRDVFVLDFVDSVNPGLNVRVIVVAVLEIDRDLSIFFTDSFLLRIVMNVFFNLFALV